MLANMLLLTKISLVCNAKLDHFIVNNVFPSNLRLGTTFLKRNRRSGHPLQALGLGQCSRPSRCGLGNHSWPYRSCGARCAWAERRAARVEGRNVANARSSQGISCRLNCFQPAVYRTIGRKLNHGKEHFKAVRNVAQAGIGPCAKANLSQATCEQC